MKTIQETLNALDEVKKAIDDAYTSGYSNGRQRTWVGLTDEEIEQRIGYRLPAYGFDAIRQLIKENT